MSATPAEASALLNLSPSAIAANIRSGDLPASKFGRKRAILITDLVRFCQTMRRIPRGQEQDFTAQLEQSLKAGIIALREIKTAQKQTSRMRRQISFNAASPDRTSNAPTLQHSTHSC